MYSRCRARERFAMCCLLALALAACERERRDLDPRVPPSSADATPLSPLVPNGPNAAPATSSKGASFENNAYHINEGQRLYRWFNCNGCHAAGGGDIGPALMDAQWRYGGSIEEIRASIVQGRPNGMPAFGGKIPDPQVWQIAAYVRALSGNVRKDAAPSRGETISATPPLTRTPAQPPKSGDPSGHPQP
jgi:cytochrome c oxidase cbb3-type subunit 3